MTMGSDCIGHRSNRSYFKLQDYIIDIGLIVSLLLFEHFVNYS